MRLHFPLGRPGLAVGLCAGLLPAAEAGPTAVPLDRVRLLYGPSTTQQTDLRYLMALDPERLLAPFKREAGLPGRRRPTATGSPPASTATWAGITCQPRADVGLDRQCRGQGPA